MGQLTGVAEVLKHNPPEFITDIRKARVVLAYTEKNLDYFPILKRDVWEAAMHSKIVYTMKICPYKIKRETMTLL